MTDLRFGFRILVNSPAFAAVAVLVLSLGIGANTAIFSLVDAILFRPLPVDRPEEIVAVGRGGGATNLYSEYISWRDHNLVFSDLAAVMPLPVAAGGRRVLGEVVSANYFPVLGVKLAIGRPFLSGERRVTVVSYSFWKTHLAADPDLAGKAIVVVVQRETYAVIGVAPAGFTGLAAPWRTDIWTPADGDTAPGTLVVGRLKPGITAAQAQAAMRILDAQLKPESAARQDKLDVHHGLLAGSPLWGMMTSASGVLMGIVGLILLLACANVANLLLARAAARRREMAIRLALGASRARLIRQLLTEGAILSLLGAVGGVLLAFWTGDVLAGFIPQNVGGGFAIDHRLDLRVLGFTLGIALLSTMLFGLAPALRASSPVSPRPRISPAGLLVIPQVALSLVVLIASGLFIRSLQKAVSTDVGFDSTRLLIAWVELPEHQLYGQLRERAAALPGVRSVSLTRFIPFGVSEGSEQVFVEGQPPLSVMSGSVDPDYFSTIGTPLLRGRNFGAQDRNVVVLNETLARRLWPDEDPVGKRIRLRRDGPLQEVIGIARDGKYRSLGEPQLPYLYLPSVEHLYLPSGEPGWPSMYLLVRTSLEPAAVVGSLRREMPTVEIKTGSQHLQEALGPARLAAEILGGLGLLALGLATVGIYGVMAYSVSRRTQEIGIRVALGARPADVSRLVIRGGVALIGTGLVIGVGLALSVTRFLSSFLYGVKTADPATYILVSLVLAAIALLASYLPARRAARVDPMLSLRVE